MSTAITGEFTPPAMGDRYTPFPLTRRGSIALDATGVQLQGTAARARFIIGIAAVIGVIAGIALYFGIGAPDPKQAASMAVFGGIIGGSMAAWISTRISRRRTAVHVPWRDVRAADVTDGELQILVERGRMHLVHFTYDSETAAQHMAAQLRARI